MGSSVGMRVLAVFGAALAGCGLALGVPAAQAAPGEPSPAAQATRPPGTPCDALPSSMTTSVAPTRHPGVVGNRVDPPPPTIDEPDVHATVAVTDSVPERLAGTDRYDTAARIATRFGRSQAVVIANGSAAKGGFDALAANYLAGRLAAPILLTGGKTLEPTTAAAVRAVLTGSTAPAIYVMGKSDSVSDTVARALNDIASSIAGVGDYVTRIGGDSRYQTAVLAATEIGEAAPGTVTLGATPTYALPTAILASGTSNADALAAGPLSNAWGLPVLLTPAGALPPDVATAIGTLGIQQLLVLGKTDRVSDAVVNRAKALGVKRVQRIAGPNRFATAADLYTLATDTLTGPEGSRYRGGGRIFVANGMSGFPDALAAGPLAARSREVLLTVSATDIDTAALSYLRAHRTRLGAVTVLGTAGTVDAPVLIAAKGAIGLNIAETTAGQWADDTDQRFAAAVAQRTGFAAKLALAKSYLPQHGSEIGALYPCMSDEGEGMDAAGLTQFPNCDVWVDNTLPDDVLLDVLRHEYIHVLQCRAENEGVTIAYADNETGIGGIERIADAGTYLLGGSYLFYVDYSQTATPLRASEIRTAIKILALFKITYTLG